MTASANRILFDEEFHWLTKAGADALLDSMSAAKLNVLVPCVWHGRGVSWNTALTDPATGKLIPRESTFYKNFDASHPDPLAYLIDEAHKRGIEVHPWITVGLRQQNFLSQWYADDDLASPNAFDLHEAGFRQFMQDMAGELSRNYKVDGLLLDYIRAAQARSPEDQADYRAMTGRGLLIDLAQIDQWGNAKNPDVLNALFAWNGAAVTDILTRMRTELLQNRPDAVLSVASEAGQTFLKLQGTDGIQWANDGLIDVLMHMDYRPFANLRLDLLETAAKTLHDLQKLVIIVANYDSTSTGAAPRSPEETLKVLQFARDWGHDSNGYGLYWYQPEKGYFTQPLIDRIVSDLNPAKATASWYDSPNALRPVFTSGDDAVDFNVPTTVRYMVGTHYDALAGNDTLLLPADSTAAAKIGYDPLRTVSCGTGNDVVTGASLADRISGGEGADTLTGGEGTDTLDGGAGSDTMGGGTGDDTYGVDNAGDKVLESANQGTDLVQASVSYTLTGNVENLTLLGSALNGTGNELGNTITGNELTNDLVGGAGNDTLYGLGGNDKLFGGTGQDTMEGGTGNDTYGVDNAGDIVLEGLGGGTDVLYATVSYTLLAGAEIEFIRANAGATGLTLTGNELANQIAGLGGNDTFFGLGGNDTLTGGEGQDNFVFNAALNPMTNVDRIIDFNATDDTIHLDDVIFTGVPLGTLSEEAFYIGADAHDADDRILYNQNTGALSFDADGSGNNAATQFATLAPNTPGIGHSDFLLV